MSLNERYFKQKDRVENHLADQVKSGRMDLAEAQRDAASDWTQSLPAAKFPGIRDGITHSMPNGVEVITA